MRAGKKKKKNEFSGRRNLSMVSDTSRSVALAMVHISLNEVGRLVPLELLPTFTRALNTFSAMYLERKSTSSPYIC